MNTKTEPASGKNENAQNASKLEPVRDEKKSGPEVNSAKPFNKDTVRNPANNSTSTGNQSTHDDYNDRQSEKNQSGSWAGSQGHQSGSVRRTVDHGMEMAENFASGAMDRGSRMIHEVEKSASSRPILSVAAAAGVGFLVGGLVSKKMHS